jgi:diguanylate cyclase (GGDEF)-like protein
LRADRTLRAALAVVLIPGFAGLLYFQAVQQAASSSRRAGFTPGDSPDGVRVLIVRSGMPAERAGLHSGDIILSVDGRPIANDLAYQAVAKDYVPGKPARLHVLRKGRPLDLTLRPGVPFPYLVFFLGLLTVVCFLGVATLALRQGLRDLRTRLLFGFSLAVALELVLPVDSVGSSWLRVAALCAFYLVTGLQIGLELHMASLIPERHAWLRGRPWVVPAYYVVGLGLGSTAAVTYFCEQVLEVHPFPWNADQMDSLVQNYTLPVWAAAVSLLLVRQAMRYPEPMGRHQAGLILSATIPWFLLLTAQSVLQRLGIQSPEWLNQAQNLILFFYPLALFAAVYRYRLFDIELVVRRSLIYTTLSGALVLVFYGALGALSLLFPNRGKVSMWAVAAAMLLLGLLFAPLRRLVHRLIDRQFFPERHEMRQRLIALAGELPALGKLPRMGQHLVACLAEIFRSPSAILLIASPETGLLGVLAATGAEWKEAGKALLVPLDDPGVEAAARSPRPLSTAHLAQRSPTIAHRLSGLDAAGLAVPLLNQDRLIGLLLVSGKADGQGYLSEEQDLLTLLAHHVATVFENARLFESATYESLTGLLRREAILEQLDRELERAVRYQRPLTLAMADLDYFKEVNDRYGHLAGDTLLKRIAQVAADGLRITDLIGRYGGEEFLVVLPETDMEGALAVAEKIRGLVQSTAVPMEDGSLAGVTISIGLASLAEQNDNGRLIARDLIAAADRSLYQAKNSGRNRIHPLLVA